MIKSFYIPKEVQCTDCGNINTMEDEKTSDQFKCSICGKGEFVIKKL